jgi:predicted signal transduction protein with EAL and GGDEF domain
MARIGGDEFAIVQRSTDQPDAATRLARSIAETLGAPFTIDGHRAVVCASIGIAVAPQDGNDPNRLLQNAELALHRAKNDGRGCTRFFEPGMDAALQARRKLELDLREALRRREFELHYQPLLRLKTGTISGFEALLRWRHPERGLVMPNEFIGLCEELGLIVPIGTWVLKRACQDAMTWPGDTRVAVNLSAMQFRGDSLVPAVVGALDLSGLPAQRLELEITETVLLTENDATLSALHQLRSLGVRVALDDFGTGYSSLSYLRSFPFDKIKLDRSFVRDLSQAVNSLAIIRAVAALSSSLGVTTTAEGVETQVQLDRVRAEGFTEAQGFLISEPVTAAEVPKLFYTYAGNSVAAA